MFRTLFFLELQASSEACTKRKMIMLIQSSGTVRTDYSSIFKDIQTYSRILMHIQAHSPVLNQQGEGRPLLHFLKIHKSEQLLEKKALIESSFGQLFHSKCIFKSILEKKLQNLSVQRSFLLYFCQTKHLSKSLNSAKSLSCHEKFLVAHLHSGIVLFVKCSILNV